MIDIHAHILPGVDDGARDWTETEALLSMAWTQGIRHIIATPHFAPTADRNHLRELLLETRERAGKLGENFEISLGQEISYFKDLPAWLEQGKALTLAESRYVLVEFRPEDGFSRLERAVRDLVQSGYFPVIAHIERYACLREKGRTGQLIRGGAYLQVNANSLLGGLFDRTTAWCRKEIAQGRVHFLATDMHNPDYRPPRLQQASEKMVKHVQSVQIQNLIEGNQQCILEDRLL